MKRRFLILFLCVLLGSFDACFADLDQIEASTETKLEAISNKTSEAAKDAGYKIKTNSKRAADIVKDKSAVAAEKTVTAVKSGGEKAGKATAKAANKATNFTARGVKHSAKKLEAGAQKVIDKTDQKIKCSFGRAITHHVYLIPLEKGAGIAHK